MIQALIIILGLAIDQLSKLLLEGMVAPGGFISVIPGFFGLRYVKNYGVGMGLLQNMQWLIIPLNIVVMLALLIFMYRNRDLHTIPKVAISMIVSGGLGNLIDRAITDGGFVRDFFEFTFVDFYVFNFADVLVTLGAVALAVYVIFFSFKKDGRANTPAAETAEAADSADAVAAKSAGGADADEHTPETEDEA